MTVFKSLEEWQKKTGFNLNNFKEVKTAESRGGRFAPTQPMVTLSKNGLSVNSYLTVEQGFDEDYLQPFVSIGDGQLMLMFSNNNGSHKYKMSKPSNGQSRHTSVKPLINELNNDSDYINTKRFRYRFVPTLVDKNNKRLIVDLKNPYQKVLVRK